MKYMACCVKFHEISRQISDWPGKKKKKKKLCDKLEKKCKRT